ncbi:unnamed protein product, partial [Ixodes persulcatus]
MNRVASCCRTSRSRNAHKKGGRRTQGSPPSGRPVSRPLRFQSTAWPQSYPRHKRHLLHP